MVESISNRYFNRPFVIMLVLIINYCTGGRYIYLNSHNSEINPKQYQYYGKNALSI